MKKNILFILVSTFLLTGCFSVSSLNPFSDSKKKVEIEEIEIPSNAPAWLIDNKIKNNITAIGFVKEIKEENLDFYKQKALIGASNNLLKRIYSKTGRLYKAYTEKLDNPKVFDKDIKKFAEHISLKSLTYSKVVNTWISEDKELYVQLAVDSNTVATQIQNTSKLLFDVDKMLYQYFLSNRANKEIIQYLEK
ncbi:hypothetical protein [Arcobacter arenosus]|uniref:hypothetical protein n=1 Tax=Arcobacter arenosus TaxID=2576037 RepID=UPI003BA8633B